jgi:hypothetical protein
MSVCLSVCLSVRLSEWNNSTSTGRIFMKFDIWEIFEDLSRKFKFLWNLIRITDNLHKNEYIFLQYLAQFFLEWEMFQTKFAATFSKIVPGFWDNVKKYGRDGQATDEDIAHEHCNTYCFSTATMVARALLIVTSYVRCLSCSVMNWNSPSMLPAMFDKTSYYFQLLYSVIIYSV